MSILGCMLVIVVVGVILYLVNAYVPMDANVRKVLNIFVIVALVIFLLQASGLWGTLAGARF